MSMTNYLQIVWPVMTCPKGKLELRINLPNEPAYDYSHGVGTTLFMTQGPFLTEDTRVSLLQKFQSSEGRRSFDDVTLKFYDKTAYSGIVDTLPVSEDFASIRSTVLSQFFRIKGTPIVPNPYRVYLTWYDSLGNRDIFFCGNYDALRKPQDRQKLKEPQSNFEIVRGTRTCQVVNYLNVLSQTAWRNVVTTFKSTDTDFGGDMLRQGDFYNGFLFVDPDLIGWNNTRGSLFGAGSWLKSPHAELQQAVPYIQVAPDQNGVVARSVNVIGFDGRANVQNSVGDHWLSSTVPWPVKPWVVHPITNLQTHLIAPSGSGYAVNDTGIITGGNGDARYKVTSVTGGAVTGISILAAGTGYNVIYNVPTTTLTGSGTGLFVDIYAVGIQWGPWGTWGIRVASLIRRICLVCGIDTTSTFSGTLSALDIYWQEADPTNLCFPVHNTPVAITDYWVSFNNLVGSHIWDGTRFESPATPALDEPVVSIIQGICDFLLCDYDLVVDQTTGQPSLVLRPLGSSTGSLPTNWILKEESSTEQIPSIDIVQVSVSNRGDNLKIVAPLLNAASIHQGSTLSREIPFRLRRIARATPQPDDGSPFNGVALTDEDVTWDTSIDLVNTAPNVFRAVQLATGDITPTVNTDCWKGLTGVYVYQTTYAAAQANNIIYPPVWPYFDNWNQADGPCFFILGAQYRHGATPIHFESNAQRFDSRNFQAVGLAYALIPSPTQLERSYSGIQANDGTLSGVTKGFTKSWLYDGAIQTFRSVELERDVLDSISRVVWQPQLFAGLFPDITDISHGIDGSTGGTSSSGTSSNESSGGSNITTVTGKSLTLEFPATVNVVELYHANVLQKTFTMSILSNYDVPNSRYVAQYGYCPYYEPAGTDTYGSNTMFLFHYVGTEHGNCYIDGISPIVAGVHVKDYWCSGVKMVKRDTLADNTNVYYDLVHTLWSEDQNKFLDQYLLEKANNNRRIYFQGRLKATWAGTGFGLCTWLTLADTVAPMSDREILVNSDINPVTALNPAATGGANFIEVAFGPRIKPLALDCMAWKIVAATPATTGAYDLQAMPLWNERATIPANGIRIFFKVLNSTGAGAFYNPFAGTALLNTALSENSSSWTVYVTIWGEAEIIGDDARVT